MTHIPSGLMAVTTAMMLLGVLYTAGFILFRRVGNTVAEAAAYGVMSTLMALSVTYQAAFLARMPLLTTPVEALLFAGGVYLIARERQYLASGAAAFGGFIREHRMAALLLGGISLYLFLQALVLPANPYHWHGLIRMRLFEAAGSFHTPGGESHALSPVSHLILLHPFMRFHTDAGVGLIGLSGYAVIAFCTYALARRYAWPPTAFTVTLLVASLPRLVLAGSSPGFDILPSAAALFTVLALYRSVEQPNFRDFSLLLLGVGFSVSIRPEGDAFPLILILLTATVLVRRHGFSFWTAMISGNFRYLPGFAVCWVFLSQTWVFAGNFLAGMPVFGTTGARGVAVNPDPLLGAAANLCRYVLQSVDLTFPVDAAMTRLAGAGFQDLLNGAWTRYLFPLFGNKGAVEPFAVCWVPNEAVSWFGPFGALLIFPGVLMALLRGPRRLKTTALALIGYLYVICLVAVWHPENARLLSYFFVCGGFSMAFLLPPWRLTRSAKRWLQVISAVLLVYAAFWNQAKPAMGFLHFHRAVLNLASGRTGQARREMSVALDESAWLETRFGHNRFFAADRLFGPGNAAAALSHIPGGARVAVVSDHPGIAYPFLCARPDLIFIEAPGPDGVNAAGPPVDFVLSIINNGRGVAARFPYLADPSDGPPLTAQAVRAPVPPMAGTRRADEETMKGTP